MSDDKNQLKAVPVRRRSAARLAAIQITYQSLITGQSAADFAPQFLSHYAAEVRKSFRVKDLDQEHLTDLYAGVEAGRDELDRVIGAALSPGWSIDRLARIELAVPVNSLIRRGAPARRLARQARRCGPGPPFGVCCGFPLQIKHVRTSWFELEV